MNYTITRYEEKSNALFVRIKSYDTPTHIEHFFTEEQRADDASIKTQLEILVAELEIKNDDYIEPETFVSNIDKGKGFTLSEENIQLEKTKIKADRIKKKEEAESPPEE